MSLDDPETKIPTLNPLFLQAVRDEATKSRKTEQADPLPLNPISAIEINETKAESNTADLEKAELFALFQQAEPISIDEPALAEEDMPEPPSTMATIKAAIANKQAGIDQTQQQLDRLIKIKAIVEPLEPTSSKAKLNDLRMKRLAIQMALVADSKEYDDKDLLAVDKQIAALNGLTACNRQTVTSAGSVERMKLNAKIDELQGKIQILTDELKEIIVSHNLCVVLKKAEDYIKALTVANLIRHELLALAEILTTDGLVMDMSLGGELPIPSGLEPFDAIVKDTLATSIEGIEVAKARIRPEILL